MQRRRTEHGLGQQLEDGDALAPGAEGNLPQRLGQAYSIKFQLLNMVEENAAVQARRAREKSQGLSAEPGLWGYWLKQLKEVGLEETVIAAAVRMETRRICRMSPLAKASK